MKLTTMPQQWMVASDVGGTKIAMALVSETAAQLQALGQPIEAFVSPSVAGIAPGHNRRVFEQFRRRLQSSR